MADSARSRWRAAEIATKEHRDRKTAKKTQGEAVPHPGLNRLRFSRIRYSSGSLPLRGSRWGGRRRCGLVVVTMMRLFTRACAGAWICRIDAGR
jgi:hypothetical protein